MFTAPGKFLLLRDGQPFDLKGLTYGPFGPGGKHGGLVPPAQQEKDLAQIASLGCNTIRTYEIPTRHTLDLAHDHGLALFATIPWAHHVDFFQNHPAKAGAYDAVRRATGELGGHPALLGYAVANELPSTLVRWIGAARVQGFLEELVQLGRARDPHALFTYASYPSTEYLVARNADFLCYNVFLEDEATYRRYLARLQLIAGDKPLVVGEFGLDSLTHGQKAQADTLRWATQAAQEEGCAGSVLFSYSDAWHRGGKEVEGWGFGIVTRDRKPKPAATAIKKTHATPPALPGTPPRFSVICCSYNGGDKIATCLESLATLDYPDYEVIVIDDGSQDDTAEVAARFADEHPHIRHATQDHAGLGVARNHGAELATGEVLAYIDDDAWAHPRWLHHLALRYQEDAGYVAVGGPNIFPPATSLQEACVALAPGRPCHVMLDASKAEHIPGCNLSVRRDALLAIGGFDPRFTAAGDDVDFCWRLIDEGWDIGFAPGAMVWHAPRRTLAAYLKQQRGYGHAEALLARKYRPRFQRGLGIHWKGGIYTNQAMQSLKGGALIYHGTFGTAGFQAIYQAANSHLSSLLYTPLWGTLCLVSLLVGTLWKPALLLALALLALQLLAAFHAAFQLRPPARWGRMKTRLILGLLHLAQPLVRNLARLRGVLPR